MELENLISYLFRWIHLFAGVTWIVILYYFNFIQTEFFKETDASTKSAAISKLVPRALWWFRWGAMWTFVTGIILCPHSMEYKRSQCEYKHTTFRSARCGVQCTSARLATLALFSAQIGFV